MLIRAKVPIRAKAKTKPNSNAFFVRSRFERDTPPQRALGYLFNLQRSLKPESPNTLTARENGFDFCAYCVPSKRGCLQDPR
jgi:hypothetical protein